MFEYLSRILVSVECIICFNGSVSIQTVRISGAERLIEGTQAFSHGPVIMVCYAILKEKVVGPCVFEDKKANSENYGNMLILYVSPRFMSLREDYIFRQNGDTADYSSEDIWAVIAR